MVRHQLSFSLGPVIYSCPWIFWNLSSFEDIVFLNVMPCIFVDMCCFHLQGTLLKIAAAHFSETSVPVYQITWCHIQEDSNLHSHHCENFISPSIFLHQFLSTILCFTICKQIMIESYFIYCGVKCWPPLWSSGQSSWLQIRRPRFDSRHYQKKKKVVGMERGPLSLVSTTEELLYRKVAAPV
jgi:hypothetical protein